MLSTTCLATCLSMWIHKLRKLPISRGAWARKWWRAWESQLMSPSMSSSVIVWLKRTTIISTPYQKGVREPWSLHRRSLEPRWWLDLITGQCYLVQDFALLIRRRPNNRDSRVRKHSKRLYHMLGLDREAQLEIPPKSRGHATTVYKWDTLRSFSLFLKRRLMFIPLVCITPQQMRLLKESQLWLVRFCEPSPHCCLIWF